MAAVFQAIFARVLGMEVGNMGIKCLSFPGIKIVKGLILSLGCGKLTDYQIYIY